MPREEQTIDLAPLTGPIEERIVILMKTLTKQERAILTNAKEGRNPYEGFKNTPYVKAGALRELGLWTFAQNAEGRGGTWSITPAGLAALEGV